MVMYQGKMQIQGGRGGKTGRRGKFSLYLGENIIIEKVAEQKYPFVANIHNTPQILF